MAFTKKMTRQQNANSAAIRWAEQYCSGRFKCTDWHIDVLHKLNELGEHPDPDAVDSIIGNSSWTDTDCSLCNAHNVPIVRFEIDDQGMDLCERCLTKALTLIRQES